MRAAEQDRPDVAEKRDRWRKEQVTLDPGRLVFIDETWANTKMTRLRGRCRRGERLVAKVPHGHWKTTTLIAALDQNGVRCSTTVDGPINAAVFEAFVEHVLVPTLRPGDQVVMDNLSSHKGKAIQDRIRAAGAVPVFLPPYSPDFNPIELAFSKIKQRLRSLACRTIDRLWRLMQSVLDEITASDALHFFQHCGYAIDKK